MVNSFQFTRPTRLRLAHRKETELVILDRDCIAALARALRREQRSGKDDCGTKVFRDNTFPCSGNRSAGWLDADRS